MLAGGVNGQDEFPCGVADARLRRGAIAVLVRVAEYGLPRIMRTDNGVPFATIALGRLSLLSVWWIRLSIYPELIEPAHPEQNGRHERMHRTLKAEATRPPSRNLHAQQS